jgi:glycosyltransferase involved in cell wall biosynthesis
MRYLPEAPEAASVMSARTPRVSIGLPVFNGERYLSDALNCIVQQTFEDFELIITDNSSTDATEDICRDAARLDRRIRYVRNVTNLGAIPNFLRCHELSTAPLFKWVTHDDLYEPTYLESGVRILDANPEVVLAHSATAFIDEAGDAFPFDGVTSSYIDPHTGIGQRPDHPSIADSANPAERFWHVLRRARWGSHMFGLIRQDALRRTRLMGEFAGSDRPMLLELALLGRFKSDPARLYKKRFHAQGSWVLNQAELKSFLSTDGKAYSRRARQLQAFFSAPKGKPIGLPMKLTCTAMVAVHAAQVALQTTKEAQNAAQGAVWRKEAMPT